MFMRHFRVYESCRHIKSEHSRVVGPTSTLSKKNQIFHFPFFPIARSHTYIISHLLNFHSYLFRTSRVVVNLVPLKTLCYPRVALSHVQSVSLSFVIKRSIVDEKNFKVLRENRSRKSNFSRFHICTVIDDRRQREVKMKILISPDFLFARRVHMALLRYIYDIYRKVCIIKESEIVKFLFHVTNKKKYVKSARRKKNILENTQHTQQSAHHYEIFVVETIKKSE